MSDRINLLIVEDDKALAQGLARALKTQDREIKCVAKIREARQMLKGEQPDLMILDVNLPDGNGFDFLGEVKAQGAFPVILLTANDLETDSTHTIDGDGITACLFGDGHFMFAEGYKEGDASGLYAIKFSDLLRASEWTNITDMSNGN